ncbi:hypothetical protein BGZ76_000727 [Entomortierella beljakovae]|nr:hypothetical protein BGZ76_000727 [Entomortierella beljakovae]
MDSSSDIFATAPLAGLTDSPSWTKLPDPPQWKAMTSYNTDSQFDCAVTSSGKVFLFGNQIGFAEYNIQSKSWDSSPPKFTSSAITTVSMKNLLNQSGLRATTDIDKTSIIIVSTSPPVFMRLNPDTKEISGTVIYTLISGLRGFCLGAIQKNPEQVILCGGAYYNQNDDCSLLTPGTEDVRTNTFKDLPIAQEGCSIDSFDVGYMLNQGLSTGKSTPNWAGDNSGASSSLLFTSNGGQWTQIKNSITTQYPLRAYSAVTYVPSMKTAVVYGGVTPQQNISSEIYTLNLADIVDSYKDNSGNSGSSGSSSSGGLVGKIVSGVVTFAIIGCVIRCCVRRRRVVAVPVAVPVYQPEPSVSVVVTVMK